ncbi:MAG: hypothetical protein COT26_01075 [Candidatus Kerfeldbacteria bacterium CG08_land_8_20_14_0_20_43_14]|uniref:Uncharacterized protein n=1 Tax=Candidatus Kerfeldbacteria bacterium CG08_land_8_20_14_0_20_43_14 TaxID=2014246 RepID=A0A2H0YQX0_9BACT|nr:MAG: hypothetical protein COT26_01075 [Candidatus Kerfeldbacteria bacterium CG08_land_8_20_14_0_20_43_14]
MPESKSAISPQKPTPKHHIKWKIIFIGLVTVIFAGVFWWTLDIALRVKLVGLPPLAQIWQLLIAIAFFCVFLALYGVFAMTRGRKYFWQTVLAAFVSSIILITFFPIRLASLGAAGIFLAGLILWSYNVAGDVNSRKKFQPHYTIHAGFGTGLLLLLIGISLCYYTSLGDNRQTMGQVRQNLISASKNPINLVLQNQIPGYKSNMTLDEFLSLVATDKFGELLVPEITKTLDSDKAKETAYKEIINQLRKVSPVFEDKETTGQIQQELDSQIQTEREVIQKAALAQLPAVQKQLLEEARREFLQTFKIEATGAEPMSEIIEKIITHRVAQYVDPYEKIIPPILALSFFFIIELISFVYRYLIFVLAPIIAWVYFKLGLIKIIKVQEEVQKVEL